MTRPSWWAWLDALQAHAPNEGAYFTATVWAKHCWTWRANDDRPDRLLARGLHIEDLAELHPRGVGLSTLKRRMKQLEAAGLVERIRGHSRYNPNTYAPTLPSTAHDRALLDESTAHDRALLDESTAHDRALLSGNRARSEAEQGSPHDGPLFSPDSPETPRARTHTRTREEGARTGGISPEGEEAMRTLLRALDYGHGDGMSARLAPGWRQQVGVRLSQLRAAGWPESDLIQRITRREFASAGSIGRVLVARLDDLAAEPVPTTAAQRAEERAQRAQQRAAAVCPHETPGGSSACPLCRHGDAPPVDDDAEEDRGSSDLRPATREEALALARFSLQQL